MGKNIRITYMWDLFKLHKFLPETDLYVFLGELSAKIETQISYPLVTLEQKIN